MTKITILNLNTFRSLLIASSMLFTAAAYAQPKNKHMLMHGISTKHEDSFPFKE